MHIKYFYAFSITLVASEFASITPLKMPRINKTYVVNISELRALNNPAIYIFFQAPQGVNSGQ